MGINKATGERRDYGKVGTSTGERVEEAGKKAQGASDIHLKEVKTLFPFQQGVIEGRESRLEDQRQTNREASETQRQTGRKELTTQRLDAALERIKTRAGLKTEKTEGDRLKVKNNAVKAQALVDAAPQKYKKFWDPTSDTVLSEAPTTDSPEYGDYVDLYNALFKDINQLSKTPGAAPKITQVGKYGVEKQ